MPARSISLTIAIPTLNCEQTLPFTLASVDLLKKAGARVVVVDSYSEDGTLALAEAFTPHVLHVPRGNLYSAVNAGLRAFPAEWMTYINSDDLLYPRTVLNLLQNMDKHTDILYGTADFVSFDGHFMYAIRPPPPSDLRAIAASKKNPIHQPGTFFRGRVFEQLGGFCDAQFQQSADFDFFVNALVQGCVFHRVSAPPLAAFRVHNAQFSQSMQHVQAREARQSIERLDLQASQWEQMSARIRHRLHNLVTYAGVWCRSVSLTGHGRLCKGMTPLERMLDP